jgi:hypothetical protein
MRRRRTIIGLATIVMVVLGLPTVDAADRTSDRASLMTVEGTVFAVETVSAEGGRNVTAVRLVLDRPESREIDVLLAPGNALSQIGFEIEAGDRLRARVFLTGEDAFEAHKVLNLSRGMMVRLRTLRRVPLWDGNGQWQGGPCRSRGDSPGTGGSQHRGTGRGGH